MFPVDDEIVSRSAKGGATEDAGESVVAAAAPSCSSVPRSSSEGKKALKALMLGQKHAADTPSSSSSRPFSSSIIDPVARFD